MNYGFMFAFVVMLSLNGFMYLGQYSINQLALEASQDTIYTGYDTSLLQDVAPNGTLSSDYTSGLPSYSTGAAGEGVLGNIFPTPIMINWLGGKIQAIVNFFTAFHTFLVAMNLPGPIVWVLDVLWYTAAFFLLVLTVVK